MKCLVLLACVYWVPLAGAQETGTKLLDRTTAIPDTTRVNPMQNKAFVEGGQLKIRQAAGYDRSTAAKDTFQTDSYTMTRSFFGIKNPWFGGKVLKTKSAVTTNDIVIPNLQREVKTKDLADNRSAFDADRAANLRDEPVKTKTHTPKAGAQGAMDVFSEQAKKEMSIEDIREILNKK
jgi:hypothetical protein